MRPVVAASASAAAAESPYPRDSAHFDRDATLSLFRLALRDVVELREIETLVAAGLNALVAANADARRARESFMVSVFCGNLNDELICVNLIVGVGEVRVERGNLLSDPLSREKWASLQLALYYICIGEAGLVNKYCHGRPYNTMKGI